MAASAGSATERPIVETSRTAGGASLSRRNSTAQRNSPSSGENTKIVSDTGEVRVPSPLGGGLVEGHGDEERQRALGEVEDARCGVGEDETERRDRVDAADDDCRRRRTSGHDVDAVVTRSVVDGLAALLLAVELRHELLVDRP